MIRSIPRWSLTSNRAHCFLELVIIYRPYSCYTAAGIVHTIYKRGYTRAKASRRLIWSHTQLGYIWYYDNTQGGAPYSISCYRYLLIWYCHLVQKMSPPYINFQYIRGCSCGGLSQLSIVDSWIGNPLYEFQQQQPAVIEPAPISQIKDLRISDD